MASKVVRPLAWVATAILAAACGAAPADNSDRPEDAGPRPGGMLTLREPADPFNWDISRSTSSQNMVGVMVAYSRLVNWKNGPDIPQNSTELEPELAERWEMSSDARTFTFELRKAARFANQPPLNGREVSADDVRWTLEYFTRSGQFAGKGLPRSEFISMLTDFDRVEVVSPHTVKVHFKRPFAPFLNYAAAERTVILPKEIAERPNGFEDFILGSGPFQLDTDKSLKGSHWVWKKNPDYFEPGKPYIDQLRFLILPEEATVYAAFGTRQIDILTVNIAQQGASEIKRIAPNAVFFEYETNFPWSPYMNQRVRPFSDERVRRAFSLALDREEMVRVLNGGRGRPQMPTVFNDYFTPDEVKQLQPHNPDEARRLLSEAGYGNGVELEIPIQQGAAQGQEYATLLQLIQAQAKKVGFNVTLKQVDQPAFAAALRSDTFQFILQTGLNFRWDIDTSMAYYHPDSNNNYTGTRDPELTRLVEAQRAEPDPAKRREIVKTAARLIATRAYDVGLFSRIRYEVWHPHVKGYGPHWNLTRPIPINIWLDR